MPNYQQTIIVGHVGKDPDELRHVGSKNTAVTGFSVAVTTNKGKQNEHTEWFNITAWGKTAEVCSNYVKKGAAIMVIGKLKTDKWQDNNGNDRYTVKLHADSIQLLGSRPQGSGGSSTSQREQRHQDRTQAEQQPAQQSANQYDDFDDDIPFDKMPDEYFGRGGIWP